MEAAAVSLGVSLPNCLLVGGVVSLREIISFIKLPKIMALG